MSRILFEIQVNYSTVPGASPRQAAEEIKELLQWELEDLIGETPVTDAIQHMDELAVDKITSITVTRKQ